MNATESSLNRSRRSANSCSSMASLMQRGASVRPACSVSASLFAQKIEMVALQVRDAIDTVILAPVLAGAVRARHHQPMQNRQEHRPLHGELEAAPGHYVLHHATAAALDPQPLEQQRSPD